MKFATAILFSASLVASAAAHGWVGTLTVGGKAYKGNKPVEETPKGAPSVVRQIANNLPVKDLTSNEIICGRDAKPAALSATAAAGDKILLDWNSAKPDGNWFHDVGPMLTYLASCGSASCAQFDATKAKWFKIAEQGQDATGKWAQAKLDDGTPASVTLPANLKPGNYLLRHELVALHTAQSPGGAEFYPSCSQITVTGSGTGAPAASELVTFPGAYKPATPGILVDVYNMRRKYQFPGPPVAAFVSGGAPPKATASAEDSTTTTAAATSSKRPTTTRAATTTTTRAATTTTTRAATTTTTRAAITTTTRAATTTSRVAATTSTHAAAPPSVSSAPPKTCKGKRSRRSRSRAVEDVPAAVEEIPAPFAEIPAGARRRHMHRVVPRSL
ncbi:glycosyl hydrolase family 61-domain-containing protein [Mycena belliarum]|uniref:lytic cellulose monooxygenase (C4-dehydrogenating) n=1 Tax=Mycena belliarum TaxID=1033014 RepID=A0AAD6U827_9AGAR|nr:glycosyl hydrolase family 61-domain-containing protein [Mycena belliae]